MNKIRRAEEKDISQLHLIKPTIREDTINERFDKQNRGEVEFLVLEKDGGIVSFVFLKWAGKITHREYPDMEDLYTKKSERSRGFGSMLIAECEKRAKEKGFKKIGLAVNPTLNLKAQKLYERLGYKHDGNETYMDGLYDGVQDWVIDLEKELEFVYIIGVIYSTLEVES